jgi:hydrophobic/amphiphilic exporter-1 (mainly G- bacteria), HAE1 family
VSVSGEVMGRDMKAAVADLQKALDRIPVSPGVFIHIGGDFEEQQKAFAELLIGFLLALLLVYMVMAAQFERLLDPLVIMFAVPFAAIGVLLILLLTGTTLNVNSYIGSIMLVGIVVNNAIVLVDYMNLKQREDGLSVYEAVILAGRTRLRPILMTTLTTVLALVPMALALGEGGEVQAPMARVVIGGLTTSTLITLVLIPVIYASVKERSFLKRVRWWRRKTTAAPGAEPIGVSNKVEGV